MKALNFLQDFEESADWVCFHLFGVIQTCTCLYSSKYGVN